VQSHVSRQLVLRNKLLGADLALTGTLAGVLTHVKTKILAARKGLLALIALVRIIARMSPNVDGKARYGKAQATVRTVSPLSYAFSGGIVRRFFGFQCDCVGMECLHVSPECVLTLECPRTVLTG